MIMFAIAARFTVALPTEAAATVSALDAVPHDAGDATVTADADVTPQQAEASINQVEADMRRMESFADDVRRTLKEQDRVKQGISHAIGYWRRQQELAQDERDQSHTKIQRLEDEVATLQHRIKGLEADKATLTADKATIAEVLHLSNATTLDVTAD